MGMTLSQIEAEALTLPEEARAQLLGALLLSFENANPGDPEVAEAWAEEAGHRDEAMERGDEPGVPADEVFRRLGSHLK
jgi:hypothetical protein